MTCRIYFLGTEYGSKLLNQSKFKQTKIYVIVDFSASKVFTHHWKSVEDFSSFVNDHDLECYSIVPKYASRELFTKIQKVERIAVSTDFGPTLRERPLLFTLNKIVKLIVEKFGNKDQKNVFRFKKILLKLYTANVMRRIVSLASQVEKVELIIPSVEPLSVALVENILSNKMSKNVNLYLRLIGSHDRGLLSLGDEFERLNLLSIEYKSRVRFGYETFPYADYLHAVGIDRDITFWSPFPPSKLGEVQNIQLEPSRNVLGFLGSAKERKGFELIPEILRKLESSGENFKLYVQQAVYPWESYMEALKLLTKSKFVELLPAVLSEEELKSFVSRCDAVVLPYDAISYQNAASAILYHAADYRIPVIATKGTGFSFEIEKFTIGIVFEELNIFENIFHQIRNKSKFFQENINLYNQEREVSNVSFLNL